MRAAFVCLALFGLASCSEGPTVQVGPDAVLLDLSGRTSSIVDGSGRFIAYPNVTGLSCTDEWAIGVRELAQDNSDGSEAFSGGLGFFLLNLKDNSIEQGLSQRKLSKRLDELGIEFRQPQSVGRISRYWNGCG